MDARVLGDRHAFPSGTVIATHLGSRQRLWNALFESLEAEYPGCTATWRYYEDGKSWLLRLTRKKKTIFWLALVPGTFRITAYFTEKAAAAIRASGRPREMKAQFRSAPGKLRGITITFRNARDVEHAKELVSLKCAS